MDKFRFVGMTNRNLQAIRGKFPKAFAQDFPGIADDDEGLFRVDGSDSGFDGGDIPWLGGAHQHPLIVSGPGTRALQNGGTHAHSHQPLGNGLLPVTDDDRQLGID